MTVHLRSTPATSHRTEHGEGPCWDTRYQRLLWVDQYAGLMHTAAYDPGTHRLRRRATFEVGRPVGAVVPIAEHGTGWMLACGEGFAHLSEDGKVSLLEQPEQHAVRPMRMNDGKCAPDGTFWAGSMAFDKTPGAGTLYRIAVDRTVQAVRTGVTISNGLAWSDNERVYNIDTATP